MEPIHVQIPFSMLKDYLEMLRKRRYDLEIYFSGAILDQIEKQDIEKLLERLLARRKRVADLVEDCRKGRVNPFPNWR